jgi:drug/metabolite transporter (DMT)-like permease
MTRSRWLGVLLIVLGIAVLLVAPQAQSCVTDFHSTACETTVTNILKGVGLALVAAAAIVLARHGAPRGGSGDSTR